MTPTMPDTTLAKIEMNVLQLSEGDLPAVADDILLALGSIDEAIRRLKEFKTTGEAVMTRWLEANGGRLESGEWIWWVGPNKKIKCKNPGATLRALYEASGGDEDAVNDCLASGAIKHGAAKKILGEKYDEHFETIIEDKLEKKLQSVNKAFTR